MPALPFFSALAPVPMASQGPASQSSAQPTSPLTQQSLSTQAPDDSAMGAALDGEQEPTFLQQFEMATQGQELAASLPAFSQVAQVDAGVDPDVNSEMLLQVPVHVPLEGALQSADPILSPWATEKSLPLEQALNLPLEQALPAEGELSENISPQILSTGKKAPVLEMSDLEKQRQAMPKYQVNEGESIQPQALQAREMNLQQASAMQGVEESSAPLVAMNPAASNKTLQSGTHQPLNQTVSDLDIGENADSELSGLKMESQLLDENIHEKPITLQPRETILKPAVSTPVEALAMQQADSTEGLQGPQTAQSTKTSALTENLQGKQAEASTEKTTAQFKMDVPPQNPQWNDQVAKRIGIMASEQLQTARIQLDPPELGALDVKIKIQGDQVSVAFASNHPSVRDALEGQAPRLRELLEQQGVELADVSVSDHQQGQSQEQADGTGDGFSSDDESWQEDAFSESITAIESDSLVDYFA